MAQKRRKQHKAVKEEYYFISSNYPEIWRKNVITGRAENERCPAVIKVLSVSPNERVLEIGTGEGRFVPLIAKQKALYVGIDISPRMLYYAKKRVSPKIMPLVDFIVAEAKHLSFRDKAFWYTTIFFVPRQEEVVREARRITKHGLTYRIQERPAS